MPKGIAIIMNAAITSFIDVGMFKNVLSIIVMYYVFSVSANALILIMKTLRSAKLQIFSNHSKKLS